MPQVALFKAIYFLKNHSDIDIDSIYRAANKIDYSYNKQDNQWKNLVIASGGNILTKNSVRKIELKSEGISYVALQVWVYYMVSKNG